MKYKALTLSIAAIALLLLPRRSSESEGNPHATDKQQGKDTNNTHNPSNTQQNNSSDIK